MRCVFYKYHHTYFKSCFVQNISFVMRQYLEFNIRADVLPGVRVVEEVQDGGDESFIDATQLTVGHALKNGAESAPLCHHNRVLQGCRIKGPHRVLPTLLHC